MKALVALCAGVLLASSTAFASELLTSVPNSSRTVTDWYKQNVYDPNNNKIGEIMDILVEPSGQIKTAIVGVGGFVGAGEKDVAVNFSSIKPTMKNNKMYLTMDTSKDDLKKVHAARTRCPTRSTGRALPSPAPLQHLRPQLVIEHVAQRRRRVL